MQGGVRSCSSGPGSMALAARKPPANPEPTPDGFAEPWRSLAIGAANALVGTPGRVGELVNALFENGQPRRPLQVADAEATRMDEQIHGPSASVSITTF